MSATIILTFWQSLLCSGAVISRVLFGIQWFKTKLRQVMQVMRFFAYLQSHRYIFDIVAYVLCYKSSCKILSTYQSTVYWLSCGKAVRRSTNQYNLCRSKMFDIVCLMSAAGHLVCYPERGGGDQPSGWEGGDSLHGQQLWHLTLTGQAVHERRSSHQGGWLPGKEGE